jgi:hypothetical protein
LQITQISPSDKRQVKDFFACLFWFRKTSPNGSRPCKWTNAPSGGMENFGSDFYKTHRTYQKDIA